MKKGILILLAALLLCLAACGKSASIQDAVPTQALPTETTAFAPQGTPTTLMIYMIGSDLEAKAGAGTRDLEEIRASGVDLSHTNVVIYAGGSPHWHNENASAEVHTLLQLTPEGYTQHTTREADSMGGSQCLADFLNYSYEHFPADQYALILWNHGDGPVIGYGKDMLFDNDSLTLQEMADALSVSPFGVEQKLAWVGFDACLMASAELACVWAPYADYLVASQEVEPSFGWDYSFLAQLGKTETPEFLQGLTDCYLSACLEYYESRDYDHRDTTLSCMDLSQAEALYRAIDDLFAQAAADVDANYNTLTAKRVQTRALGRASTGSEYDLIDLRDLASQLNDLYPAQAQQLQQALDAMVLANATNAESCCGLSLYYPFYNKSHYEASWGDVYAELGLFPNYLTYLQSYQQIWLRSDLLETAAASTLPSTAAGKYTLELTPEQADAFASARYYILRQEGTDLYTYIFSSQNVTRQGTTLTANFDGDILYAQDDFGEYMIPVSVEHDTAGDITRYSVQTNLNNSPAFLYITEDFQHIVEPYRFQLAVNNRTKEISVSALTPYTDEVDTDTLMGGKAEDVDLSQWTSYIFPMARNRYLTRYENGVIQPINNWPYTSYISYYEYPIGNGIDFFFAPLLAGQYHLLFEIEDTQGNRYCSEPLPIEATGTMPDSNRPDPIHVDFTSGDRVLLTEHANVEVYLVLREIYGAMGYGIELVNHNDFPISALGSKLYINENTYLPSGSVCAQIVEPGMTSDISAISFDVIDDLSFPEGLHSMRFLLNIENAMNQTTILYDQEFRVTLPDQLQIQPDEYWAAFNSFDLPYRNMLAREQILLETEDMRLTLLGLGGSEKGNNLAGAVCMENLSDEQIIIQPCGASFDGIFLSIGGSSTTIPPHCKVYDGLYVSDTTLDQNMIDSIRSVEITFETTQFHTISGGGGFAEQFTLPVKLEQSGRAARFREGSRVLLNENGIKITYLYQEALSNGSYYWYITVANNTDEAISLDLTQEVINGQALANSEYIGQAVYDTELGPHQKRVAKLAFLSDDIALEQMDFCFQIKNFNGETILYTSDKVITIIPEPVPEEP